MGKYGRFFSRVVEFLITWKKERREKEEEEKIEDCTGISKNSAKTTRVKKWSVWKTDPKTFSRLFFGPASEQPEQRKQQKTTTNKHNTVVLIW